jgi:hypothetical protein
MTSQQEADLLLSAFQGRRKLDRNDIDAPLHAIKQMVLVAVSSIDGLFINADDPEKSEMPSSSADLLVFAIFDLLDRVEKLESDLAGGVR